jgi:DUF2914 family protein
MRVLRRALCFLLGISAWACRDGAAPASDASAPESAVTSQQHGTPATPLSAQAPTPSAPPTSAPAPSGSAAPAAPPPDSLELLKLTLTSAVKDKEPADTLSDIAPGERVYAHLKFRNRSEAEQEIRVTFKVNGKTRTTVKLDVEPSWSFRTWGYNTLQDGDTRGELTVTVTDDDGATIAEASLPIHKNAR